jgi:valyl-tRNA synthetase
MRWAIAMIEGVRSVRAQMNVPAGAQIPALLIGGDARTTEWAARHAGLILRLARLSAFELADEAPKGAVQCVTNKTAIELNNELHANN